LELRSFGDPSAFLARARDLLLADEARHNLLLGIAATVAEMPDAYRDPGFWVVEADERAVLAALRTPPFNLALSRPTDPGAVPFLATALAELHVDLPGVAGARPEVEEYVEAWCRATGDTAVPRIAQRIYRLSAVRAPAGVPGAMREAGEADRDLLRAWNLAFMREALEEPHLDEVDRLIDRRLASRDGGFALWEDGGVAVSLAGCAGRTPNGIRIGPVYTPPERRARGYAGALVAALSARSLARGLRFCFLYTDLANPTANSIYRRIGYEPVCDSAEYAFERTA